MASQYVGIDLHRRRSVIVRQAREGEVVDTVRIDNDPVALSCAIAEAGPDPEVVLEATYGWYWAVDVLEACGATVHLAHPLGVKAFAYRRGQERRARRERSGGPAAHGPAARGVDRAAVPAAAARVRQIPREAGRAALGVESRGATCLRLRSRQTGGSGGAGPRHAEAPYQAPHGHHAVPR